MGVGCVLQVPKEYVPISPLKRGLMGAERGTSELSIVRIPSHWTYGASPCPSSSCILPVGPRGQLTPSL